MLMHLEEITRLTDFNHPDNKCAASEAAKKELQNYLSSWVGIEVSKLKQLITGEGLWMDHELKRR